MRTWYASNRKPDTSAHNKSQYVSRITCIWSEVTQEYVALSIWRCNQSNIRWFWRTHPGASWQAAPLDQEIHPTLKATRQSLLLALTWLQFAPAVGKSNISETKLDLTFLKVQYFWKTWFEAHLLTDDKFYLSDWWQVLLDPPTLTVRDTCDRYQRLQDFELRRESVQRAQADECATPSPGWVWGPCEGCRRIRLSWRRTWQANCSRWSSPYLEWLSWCQAPGTSLGISWEHR